MQYDKDTIRQELANHICQAIYHADRMYEGDWGWQFNFEYRDVHVVVDEDLSDKHKIDSIRIKKRVPSWTRYFSFFIDNEMGQLLTMADFTKEQQYEINTAFTKQKSIIRDYENVERLQKAVSYF